MDDKEIERSSREEGWSSASTISAASTTASDVKMAITHDRYKCKDGQELGNCVSSRTK